MSIIRDGRHLGRSSNTLMSFSTELEQIHVIMVSGYSGKSASRARHSGVARKHFEHRIVDKSTDAIFQGQTFNQYHFL